MFLHACNIKFYTFEITIKRSKTFYDFLMDIFPDKDSIEEGEEERERERGRERESMCVCFCECVSVSVIKEGDCVCVCACKWVSVRERGEIKGAFRLFSCWKRKKAPPPTQPKCFQLLFLFWKKKQFVWPKYCSFFKLDTV
jgi:hypothetical protein